MNAKLLSLLAGVALCAGAGMASAATPVALTDAQMDGVTAGAIAVSTAAQSIATAGGSLIPINGTVATTGATVGVAASSCCTPVSSTSTVTADVHF